MRGGEYKMENDNRKIKTIAIVALLLAVVGVSVGFAAFTRTLTINNSAVVNPNEDFDVVFSKSDSSVVTTGGVDASSKTPNDLVTETAIISNDNQGGPLISNLKATFTQPGQSATYTFYAYNDSTYTAYLKNIVFNAASTKCAASTGSSVTTSLMNAACPDIKVKISVGSDTNTANKEANTSVSSHSLAAGAGELITVVIYYDEVANQTLADGPFDVDLGSIQLIYRSNDTAS